MKPTFHESEIAFSVKPQNQRNEQKGQALPLEILSYDMHTNDLYKVIEVAVRSYTEAKGRYVDYVNDEHFYMSASQEISDNLESANICDGPWQVIIGQHYGSFVTHESFYFVNFKYDDIWFTIYVSS